MILNYKVDNNVNQQEYGDATLVKDCIDEVVAINGSHDNKITVTITWTPE